jgi:hypothetical protein
MQHLLRMQQRMKHLADRNRRERQFSVGDRVFLRLQPYIQTSVAPRANHKLAFKFFGPFTVLDRVGAVAYKLDLPASSRVHPVFHVSQLKPCVGPGTPVSSTLPAAASLFQVPVQVLRRRVRHLHHRTIPQGLIHWSGAPEDEATWEDLDELQQHFPRAPAWGQAGIRGEGIVSVPGAEGEKEAEEELDEVDPGPGPKDVRPTRLKKKPAWLNDGNWQT